jgi:RNA polymerase sigma factor (sigma-70 family)
MQPFEAVVAEHGQVVMRVCRALLGPVEAEDAWSETFLAALRAYPSLRPGSNVRGWLVTIAHNKAVDQIRGRVRVPVPAGDVSERVAGRVGERVARRVGERVAGRVAGVAGGSSAPEVGTEPVDTELHSALAALPPKQRGAVVYRYLADLPYAEVAALRDCSPAAARRSAADGIARLRRHYGKDLSDDV